MLPVSKSNKYDTKYIFVSFNHEIIKIKTHVWKWVSRLLEGVLNIVDFDLLDMLNNCLKITYMMR